MLLKSYGAVAIVVCICFMQMCHCVDEQTMKEYLEYNRVSEFSTYLNGSDAIKDIGPQFVEDMHLILEKFDKNPYVTKFILRMMDILANDLNGKNSKITLTTMNEIIAKIKAQSDKAYQTENDKCPSIDWMNILQSIMLKQLPPERISGVINLFYVFSTFGTEKDIENTLEYIYATDARQTTVNPNIQLLYSQKCAVVANSTTFNHNKFAIDQMKSINSTKMNPKILNDAQIIADKFPYTTEIMHLLNFINELLPELNEKNSTNDICELKNQNPWFRIFYADEQWAKRMTIDLEIILSSRVPEEKFMDMINLMRAHWKIDGSDWKRALEYAYSPDFFKAESCH